MKPPEGLSVKSAVLCLGQGPCHQLPALSRSQELMLRAPEDASNAFTAPQNVALTSGELSSRVCQLRWAFLLFIHVYALKIPFCRWVL